ncbi:alkaline phosphatase D family protein [Erythrobacter sp. SCSIO 43205]|uniref:alkaline phosphatase D family protein n=1 Tax=Erythrobacter sp. SCSIO 43205 TaxID=2779361 RepID=UPI001CA8AD01|nr:alkaline phosphatase D family protein [Erythrobacter sp. SCSIO 43205]UAB78562.1 alkaline phosphatase D family protein [Erythrobacter sp. SCSIO 43205]
MIKTDSLAQPKSSSTNVTRRGVFALAGASAAVVATPSTAKSFGTGFTHSVASGEPSASSVLLWTRYVGDEATTLQWQVSESANFADIVAQGEVTATPSRDYCAKAIATGLWPDRWYFYRFVAPSGATSPVGRTRTLPQGPTSKFRMAVFSCANFGFGYFNAYAHAAEVNDVDLAVHLGDYIYEYGGDTYPSEDQRHPDRSVAPGNEIVALADYRQRYASYRADPDLQRLHQVLPMIAVWDDHESTNDSWKDGAQNHQPETEGSWEVRKAIAKRVYREWMPVSDEPYAAYDVGDLATLMRIDTRLEGRDEQFSLTGILAGKDSPEAMVEALIKFRDGEYVNPDRQLLGAAQEAWLANELQKSTARGATWQVLVQQVLIGKLSSPKGIASLLGDNVPEFARARLTAAAMAAEAGVPLNMDAWDGYPAARTRVFEAARKVDANLVVLAGDTHNAWAFDLAHEGEAVGVEFGTSSVSSPGFESYLASLPPAVLEGALVSSNDELKWADTSQRGYMMVEMTPEAATCEWRFTASIKSRSAKLAGTKSLTTLKDKRHLEL